MPTLSSRILLISTLTAGLAALPIAAAAEPQPLAGAETSSALTGTVTVVNTDTRLLTIRTPEGRFEVLRVPPEVTRLDAVRIGDTLTITRTEFVLLDLHKGAGTRADAVGGTQETTVVRDPGNKPAGVMIESLTISGVVESVDKVRATLRVRGPERTVTLRVNDAAILAALATGDVISATYLRSISGEIKAGR